MPCQIVRNDITKMSVDVIVNTANPYPQIGTGTDSAIYRAAGEKELLEARRRIGRIQTGEAAVTPAFGLPAKYIIHTVGPAWKDGRQREADQLRSCYERSLKLAAELGCESIAFPLISSGNYGFPKDGALHIAFSVISSFLMREEMMVYLVVYDRKAFELSGRIFRDVRAYIDETYVEEQKRAREQEYVMSMAFFEEASVYESGEPKERCRLSETRRPPQIPSRSLDDLMKEIGETFSESLLRLIDRSGMTDVEVYKRANIDRKLFSKIRSHADYRPGKKTVLALAIALELSLDETKDLLARAGLALSPSDKFDVIVRFFISNQIYDIYTINLALFEHEQMTLGG